MCRVIASAIRTPVAPVLAAIEVCRGRLEALLAPGAKTELVREIGEEEHLT